MRDWQREVHNHIAHAVKDLPPDATLKDRRAALRKEAPVFHLGTSWGKRVWSKAARKYLEQHGLPKRTLADVPVTSKQHIKIVQPDITFPFRNI